MKMLLLSSSLCAFALARYHNDEAERLPSNVVSASNSITETPGTASLLLIGHWE
jgi:hypothetical protein